MDAAGPGGRSRRPAARRAEVRDDKKDFFLRFQLRHAGLQFRRGICIPVLCEAPQAISASLEAITTVGGRRQRDSPIGWFGKTPIAKHTDIARVTVARNGYRRCRGTSRTTKQALLRELAWLRHRPCGADYFRLRGRTPANRNCQIPMLTATSTHGAGVLRLTGVTVH